ncbi:DTW domain-containing protein, partial [Oleiphilus sp. HI0068]
MHLNAVSKLRDEQSKKIHRPFSARGSKLERCPSCLLVEHHCICAERPVVEAACAFCFILYQGEVFKPSNTGRIIADLIPDNYAFQWQRTEQEAALRDLLENPDYFPIVVFPHEYAEADQCIRNPVEIESQVHGKRPLFIILDGTWREAKKMFRSAYLRPFPVLGISPEKVSNYQLREASQDHQLCTAEVGVEVLKLA